MTHYRVYNDFFGPDVAVVEWSFDPAKDFTEKRTRVVFVGQYEWHRFLDACVRKNNPGPGELAWRDEDIASLFDTPAAYRLER